MLEDIEQIYICADLGLRQLENAAIVFSSWQRPAMLIDPNGDGVSSLQWLHRSTNGGRLHVLDMDTRRVSAKCACLYIQSRLTPGNKLSLQSGCCDMSNRC